jgi:DNA-binding NtrC family response regulator
MTTPAARKHASILVVDDESAIREILVRWLSPEGYRILEAADAEAALDVLAASPVDVLVSDIQMPGHDGLWLVKRVRERFPTVAIVLATADDTVPAAISMQSGVVHYVVKPFERHPVVTAVARAVEWHHAAEARGPVKQTDTVDDWLKRDTP